MIDPTPHASAEDEQLEAVFGGRLAFDTAGGSISFRRERGEVVIDLAECLAGLDAEITYRIEAADWAAVVRYLGDR